jgi:hypothetical protein
MSRANAQVITLNVTILRASKAALKAEVKRRNQTSRPRTNMGAILDELIKNQLGKRHPATIKNKIPIELSA